MPNLPEGDNLYARDRLYILKGECMNKSSFIGKIVSGVLIIIAMIAFKPSVAIGLDEMPKFVEYVSSGNYFKCNIPADWSVYDPGFGLSEEEKKVYGVTLFGPQNGSQVSTLISIHYYAPGNSLHKTMDKFVRIHSGSILGLEIEGQSYGKIRQIKIAGREAKTFERIDIRFIGERAINMPKVSIYENFIVIPARKDEGFYVLELSVPKEIKDKYKGIFEETVKSFLPER